MKGQILKANLAFEELTSGDPTLYPWKLKIPDTSLTDNGGGIATLDYAAGIGSAITNTHVIYSNGSTLLGSGNFTWDNTNLTLDVGNIESTYIRSCVNASGVQISKGKVVYIISANGDKPTVGLADNTNHTKAHVYGMANETATIGADIDIAIFGKVIGTGGDNLDTSGFAEGSRLHLTTAGNYTVAVPSSGAHIHIGFVTKSNINTGIIELALEIYTHDIRGVSGTDVKLAVGSDANTEKISFQNYSAAELGYIDGTGLFSWAGLGTIADTWTWTSGSIGIGVTPTAKLDIFDTTATAAQVLKLAGTFTDLNAHKGLNFTVTRQDQNTTGTELVGSQGFAVDIDAIGNRTQTLGALVGSQAGISIGLNGGVERDYFSTVGFKQINTIASSSAVGTLIDIRQHYGYFSLGFPSHSSGIDADAIVSVNNLYHFYARTTGADTTDANFTVDNQYGMYIENMNDNADVTTGVGIFLASDGSGGDIQFGASGDGILRYDDAVGMYYRDKTTGVHRFEGPNTATNYIELDVADSNSTSIVQIFGVRGGAGGAFGRINFRNTDSVSTAVNYVGAKIDSFNDGATADGDLRFYTEDNATGTTDTDGATERMRIASDGIIELGTPTSNYSQFDADGDLSFVGTARIDWTKITADSITLNNEGGGGGVVANIQSHDGTILNFIEQGGGAPRSGMIVDFVSVEAFNWVQILATYVGAGNHAVVIQLWDWTGGGAWVTFNTMQTGWHSATTIDVLEDYSFFVPNDSNFIGTGGNVGEVRVRFEHDPDGNAAHDWYFGVVALY